MQLSKLSFFIWESIKPVLWHQPWEALEVGHDGLIELDPAPPLSACLVASHSRIPAQGLPVCLSVGGLDVRAVSGLAQGSCWCQVLQGGLWILL